MEEHLKHIGLKKDDTDRTKKRNAVYQLSRNINVNLVTSVNKEKTKFKNWISLSLSLSHKQVKLLEHAMKTIEGILESFKN